MACRGEFVALIPLFSKHICSGCHTSYRHASCASVSLLKSNCFSRRQRKNVHDHAIGIVSPNKLLDLDLAYSAGTGTSVRGLHATAKGLSFSTAYLQSLKRHPVLFTTFPSTETFNTQLRNYAASSKQEGESRSSTPKLGFWARFAVVGAIAGGIWWYAFHSVDVKKEIEKEQVRYEEFKKANLGGDFTLTDHHGKVRSSTEFHGQWVLMYFGFTHCPDICPEELEKLMVIVKEFDDDPKLPNLMPIFITLDPNRDNPKVIKDYLAEFNHPRFLGFTGTDDEIREVAKRFRAYYSKGPADEDNDYIVDHTIIIYLVNPKGEFVNYYDRSRSASRITNSVKDHIYKFNELQKLQQQPKKES